MNDLTVVVLTKNEEFNIISFLDNVKKVTNNVLVVDSGSSDNTVALAENHGCKVVYRKWDDDFSAQRNFALKYVNTKWILYLDADERLDNKLMNNISKVIKSDERKQYEFYREVHAFGFKYKYGIFKPDKVIRMFQTNSVIWKNKIHERPECNYPKCLLEGYIIHYTYKNWQHWLDKLGQYTTIWAEENFSKGKRICLIEVLLHGIYGFISAYIVKRGFLDGWAGFFSSLQHFLYTIIKYLKLYEIQNNQK